jgi:FlaA1/EpsC-like NDP-sugar epimerase
MKKTKFSLVLWILCIDVALCVVGWTITWVLKYGIKNIQTYFWDYFFIVSTILIVQVLSLWLFGEYRAEKLVAPTRNQRAIFFALTMANSIIGAMAVFIYFYIGYKGFYLPISLVFIDYLVAMWLLVGYRFVWYHQEQSPQQRMSVQHPIHQIKIEDLLEREPISLHDGVISEQIQGKTILITGAAGSIGSELVRQVLRYKPAFVAMLDQAESALHDLEFEIIRHNSYPAPASAIKIIVANVTDENRMRQVFEQVRPDWVFHAAAYKHVPIMESHPYEAAKVNIWGTKIVADLSLETGVEKFVMVSTDKAVNPTNIMGATKRLAEMYTQSLNQVGRQTRFIATRFGNVLGSNGSVIPLFKKQIESGGPITVTHPDINRFFMTIPEACQLVLEAGAMGRGGEVFVFDMGKSVRIVDLARKMIRLSGLTEGEDIRIVFTGLRPGEKLYEELLHNDENTLTTHHPKIMIAKVVCPPHLFMRKITFELKHVLEEGTDDDVVRVLKKHIPEYISNNSIYEMFDLERK